MKKIYSLAIALLTGLTASAQVNLANFDFNGSSSLPVSATTTTTNITASVNGTESNAAYTGTVTGSSAFISNTTAGNALSMSANTNTNTWTLTLGGSDLNKYMNYKMYFQSERSSTGATSITIAYSTDGSTYTALSQTVSTGNTIYAESIVDLSSVTGLNNQTAIYLRITPSGASAGGGTLRLDNLQIQAALSPWTISGGNVNFTGGVTATSFTTTGDAKINGNLIASGLTATSSSLSVTAPAIFSNTIKNTSLAGTGSRLLLTDATGLISPLTAGTSSQVLSGVGTWIALPAQTFTTSGSNAYFTGGNLGIGTATPTYSLDVSGTTRLGGNTAIKGNTSITGNTAITGSVIVSSLGGSSDGSFVYVDSLGNLKNSVPVVIGTSIAHCVTQAPWMIGGNKLGSIGNAIIGTCDSHDFILEANNNADIWIKPNGFVGIGNPSPGAVLDVMSSGTNAGFNVGNNLGTSFFSVASNGKVGVANTSPAAMLDITTSGSTAGFNISNSDIGLNIFSVTNSGDLTITGGLTTNGPITANVLPTGTPGTGYFGLLIDASGNVVKSNTSVLNSTASWNLGGNGTHAGAVASSIGTTDGNDLPIVTNNITRILVTQGGNVGIGTSSPNALLEVNGAAIIDGTIKIAGGSPQTNYVLTSTDGSGNATWKVVPDNQTLSLSGNNLSISNGNSVTLPTPTGDNMGNCTATADVNMQGHEVNYVSDIHFNPGSAGGITFGTGAILEPVFVGGNYGIGTSAGADFEVGDDLIVTDAATVENGNLTIENGNLEINVGDATIGDDISIGGDATITGSLNSGAATLSSLSVSGNSTLHGLSAGSTSLSSLDVSGNVTINNDLSVDGDADCSGDISNWSDRRFKRDINKLESVTDKIKKLSGYTYYFKTEEFKEKNFSKNQKIGFLAQEIQEIFPQLVKEKDGYLMVNYIGMVPVLLEAVKEQQKIIDSLHNNNTKQDSINNTLQNQLNQLASMINNCCTNSTNNKMNVSMQNIELSNKDAVVLNQNVPNPFAEQTVISYNIPQNASSAQLLFYDALGRQIKTVDIVTKGAGQLNVYANDLTNGIYSYTLIVDGNIAATKKMIKQQ